MNRMTEEDKKRIEVAKKIYDQARKGHKLSKHGSLWLKVNAEVCRDRVREIKSKYKK